jgi:hypothetical protein
MLLGVCAELHVELQFGFKWLWGEVRRGAQQKGMAEVEQGAGIMDAGTPVHQSSTVRSKPSSFSLKLPSFTAYSHLADLIRPPSGYR